MKKTQKTFHLYFLMALFVSAFWVVDVGAEVIVADFSEADLEGDMRWGEFLDNCVEGATPYSSGGIFDSINVHLIIDTDKETVTGSLSGSGSGDSHYSHLYTEEFSFDGVISGTAKRVFWGGYMWEWVFEADVELDLSFSTSRRCNTPTSGEYIWISREETIHVIKTLRANTAPDNNQQFISFGISWKDYDEYGNTPVSYYMDHKNEDEQGRAILPLEMPDPIDLSIEVSVPEFITKESGDQVFVLDASGEQKDMIKKVYWYFWDWDEGFGEYRWFETFKQTSLDDLIIDSGKISEWMKRVDQFGESGVDGKSLPMQVSVEFERDEKEWLAITQRYNFTVFSTPVISGSSDTTVPPVSESSTSDTESLPESGISPSFFGGLRGALITFGGVTLGGYGLFRFLKRKPSTSKKESSGLDQIKLQRTSVVESSGSEMKLAGGVIVDPPDIPGMKPSGYPLVENTQVEEIDLTAEDSVKNLDSLHLQQGSEINTEINIDPSEDALIIKPASLDGALDTSNLSMEGSGTEIGFTPGSQVRVDVENIPHEDSVTVDDTTRRLEGKLESNEETLDSLNLQQGSEINTEVKQTPSETTLNINPNSLDGRVEESNISIENKTEIGLTTGSQVKIEIQSIKFEDTVPVEDATLRLDGDVESKEETRRKKEIEKSSDQGTEN